MASRKALESIGKVYRIEDKVEKSFNELHCIETLDGNCSFNIGRSDTESSDSSESTKNTSNNHATVPDLTLHLNGSLQFKHKIWITY